MTDELFRFIIQRIIDSSQVDDGKKNDFNDGRRLGYYEVADIIKSELKVHELDPKKFGLNFKLERLLND